MQKNGFRVFPELNHEISDFEIIENSFFQTQRPKRINRFKMTLGRTV